MWLWSLDLFSSMSGSTETTSTLQTTSEEQRPPLETLPEAASERFILPEASRKPGTGRKTCN